MKRKIFLDGCLGSRKYTRKVFSMFGHTCKSFFLKNIFLRLAPQYKIFYRKNVKKIYTYNTIKHLKIPIYIIYAHPLIPITKNINIYTSKFYITITEVPIYKNQRSTQLSWSFTQVQICHFIELIIGQDLRCLCVQHSCIQLCNLHCMVPLLNCNI